MEQLTLFDLQNDLATGSLCDNGSELVSSDAAALVLSEARQQELREAYTATLAPDAYRPSLEGGDAPATTAELLAHLSSVREKRLQAVDLSVYEAPSLPEKEAEETESLPSVVSIAKEKIKLFFSGLPFWFDGKKPEESGARRLPVSAFAAIGVLALCLALIVSGSILVTRGESANNRLKKELSQVSAQIEDLRSDICLSEDVLLIREIATKECGMIGEEYVRTETLSLGNAEVVETYPDGKPEGVGLSTLLSAIGIKK